MSESVRMLELTRGDYVPMLQLTRGERVPLLKATPEELQDFANTDNYAGLMVLSYFLSHRQYPTYDQFEGSMQELSSRSKYPPRLVNCFRIAGVES